MSARQIIPSLLKRPVTSTFSQCLLTRSVSTNSAINRGLRRSPANNREKRDFKPRGDREDREDRCSTARGGRLFTPSKGRFKPDLFPGRDRSQGEFTSDHPRNKAQRNLNPKFRETPSAEYHSTKYQDIDTDRPSPRLDKPPSGIWTPPESPRPAARTWAPSPEAYTDAFPGTRSWQPPNKSNPRLDYTPQDVEWTPKPRRFIPKIDYDAEWIYGSSVVEAALKAKRRKVLRLYIYAGRNRTMEAKERDKIMASMARGQGAEVIEERDPGVLDSMSDSRPHNGYVLECLPLPKTPILSLGAVTDTKSSFSVNLAQHTSSNEEIPAGKYSSTIYNRDPKKRYPFVLMLDEILDPGNLGAVLRSAYFLGVTAVTVSSRNCAPLSPVCLKASTGAAEFIPILEQSRSDKLITSSIENGWTFYAAVPPATKQQMRRV